MAGLMTLGVLGGTFDPPHYGHLVLAEQARDQLGLRCVLWIPAGDPPHKQGKPLSPPEDRVAMVERAISTNDGFALSRIDLDRGGPHYSVDMAKLVAVQYPHEQIYFLIGGDSLRDMASWHRPTELIKLVTLAVMLRDTASVDLVSLEKQIPGLQSRVRFLDAPQIDASSEHIRAMVRSRRSVRYQLPDSVLTYIQSRNLYTSSLE